MPASDYDLFSEFEDFGANDPEYRTSGHFQDYLELYRASGAGVDDADSDREMFYQFLNAFTPDTEPQTADFWRDIRDLFYEMSGITEEDIDWELYRRAIGY
jgi:hypothetical protein